MKHTADTCTYRQPSASPYEELLKSIEIYELLNLVISAN